MSSAAIRILFLGANPSDTTRLALGQEVREINQRLRTSLHRARFEVVEEWAVRAANLSAALMRHRPQVVHFSGHGERLSGGGSPSPGARGSVGPPANGGAKPASGLVVEDASGKHVTIEAGPLAKLFQLVGKQVRCVVLNACHSAVQADAIGEHVDYVVGMSDAILDASAIAFAGAFYEALGFGESVETAFELGKVPRLHAREGLDPSRRLLVPAPDGRKVAGRARRKAPAGKGGGVVARDIKDSVVITGKANDVIVRGKR